MANKRVGDEFAKLGGTELACMSTTKSVDAAIKFGKSDSPLYFKIVSTTSLERGADISFLSVFPGEQEVLYPPLTYMRPIGEIREEMFGGRMSQGVTVRPGR